MSLHPVHGHERLRTVLAQAASRDSVPHALLLHGAPGVGKQRLALWIAQLLFCEATSSAGPCDACRSCRLALRLEHPDLHWYFPLAKPKGASRDRLGPALEDARARVLAQVRSDPLGSHGEDGPQGIYLAAVRELRRRAIQRPAMAGRQVFIIARAEELVPQESSPEAANALLKLLEEPPADTSFFLTSGEPGRLLPTIRSRTLPLFVPALATREVAVFLETTLGTTPAEAELAARLSQGAIGRAMGFLAVDGDPGPLERLRSESWELLQAGLSGHAGAWLTPALGYPVSRARGLVTLFTSLECWIRDLGAVAAGVSDTIVNVDALDRLEAAARERSLHPSQAARALESLDEARILAAGNVNPQLVIAGLLRGLQRAFAPTGRPH